MLFVQSFTSMGVHVRTDLKQYSGRRGHRWWSASLRSEIAARLDESCRFVVTRVWQAKSRDAHYWMVNQWVWADVFSLNVLSVCCKSAPSTALSLLFDQQQPLHTRMPRPRVDKLCCCTQNTSSIETTGTAT